VKELRGRRAVHDLDTVLGAGLKEALDAGARVLRPLALEAMGEQHHQAVHTRPLHMGRGDELVDDHLGAVHEVAELGLPQHQGGGVREAVAVLEAQHRGLGEKTVVDLEARLVLSQVGQRCVLLPALLIDEDRMAVTESSPRAVLSG